MPFPVAAVSGIDNRVVGANPAWLRLTAAADPPAAMHRLLSDLFPDAAGTPQQVLRNDMAVSQPTARIAATLSSASTWWDLHIVPHPDLPDVVLVTAHDVTDWVLTRRSADQAQAALQPVDTRLGFDWRARNPDVGAGDRSRALTNAPPPPREEKRRQTDQDGELHSQKLEALGQLTAGVAHDFNNVLAVITGSLDLIERRTQEPRLLKLVRSGKIAVDRGAALSRQLLDFGRQEPIMPVVLDLSKAMPAANSLIGHAIGSTIKRVLAVEPDIWPVLADPHQIDIALLNLAINARDAMPNGGTLSLTARNLPPQARPVELPPKDYVAIGLADTGKGMSPDVLARATEPFFTTKRIGEGTGLGLPMVHGFARKSGGCLRINSRPGDGTCIEIILPRAPFTHMNAPVMNPPGMNAPSLNATRDAPQPEWPPTAENRKASILLVEDNEQVRRIIGRTLQHQGHTVVEADSAAAAMVLSHSIARLDLLLISVTTPHEIAYATTGATGPALAKRLRYEWPDLQVLFMTDQPDCNDLAGQAVLKQPFTGDELTAAVQQCMRTAGLLAERDPLMQRLHNPALQAAYLNWQAARDGDRPPRLLDLERSGLPEADNAFTVAVEVNGTALTFRKLRLGRSLLPERGRPVEAPVEAGAFVQQSERTEPAENQPAPHDKILGSLEVAYRRCVHTRAPSYESASYDTWHGQSMNFERLLLPVSDDGVRLTHLVGIVRLDASF